MQKAFAIFWKVRVDHQFQIRQVDAPRRHVGGDAHPRAPVAHGLQGVGAFVLAQFARQRDDRKASVGEAAGHAVDGGAGAAEYQGVFRLEVAQHVYDGVFAVVGRHGEGAVFDVEMLLFFRRRADAHRVALVTLGEGGDGTRHGGGKHQRAPFGRRGVENVFQVVAKTHIEHFVGFVQHHGPELRRVEGAAFDVIAQPSRRADHDVRAALQDPAFFAHVHAADAGRDGRPRQFEQPFQLALDLQRQFPRRGDGQRQGCGRAVEPVGAVQ